jgi:hypothetical protein
MDEISSGVCGRRTEADEVMRNGQLNDVIKSDGITTHEFLLLSLEFDLDDWLATLVNDLEWPVLHVSLDLSVGEFSTNETLGIEDGVVWVHGDLRRGGMGKG